MRVSASVSCVVGYGAMPVAAGSFVDGIAVGSGVWLLLDSQSVYVEASCKVERRDYTYSREHRQAK